MTGHWWESVPNEAVRFLGAYAGGRSVRALAGTKILPAQLTRRMCHLLTTPPHRMGFVAMVRRAQVLGCGGTEQLARSLHLMELCDFKSDENYWADVIHWLCRQDLPDRRTIKAIVEFLDQREFYDERVAIHGRTWRSVLRDAERLQREEARLRRIRRPRRLPAAATPESRPCADLDGFTANEWAIARIRSARKLVLEGAAMRHCVADYRPELAAGISSFWSLTCGGKRRLTIEVRSAEMRIVEICGKANRRPRQDEMRQVEKWAQSSGLALDGVLFGR